jgi:transposase
MYYLGVDVSKAKLDCSLLIDLQQAKRKSKSIANTSAGITNLLNWLVKQGVPSADLHVVMEGTGVYHQMAAYALHDAGVIVSIANPAQVRDFARGLAIRSKTDDIDSFVLARYGAMLQPVAWQPPPAEIRQLQALITRLKAIEQDLQRERNRLEKVEIIAVPAAVRDSTQRSIQFLEQQIKAIQREVDDHIDRYPGLKNDLYLLQSIPAIGAKTSCTMLAVIRSKAFTSAAQLAAYLGLVPIERQSGTSLRGRAHLSKTGPAEVRAMLYMAAIVAIRHNPHIKAMYEQLLQRGKAKMAAIGAAMRKLVHLCFGVLKRQQLYQANYA